MSFTKAGNGRRLIHSQPSFVLLQMQHWYNMSDPSDEKDALYGDAFYALVFLTYRLIGPLLI